MDGKKSFPRSCTAWIVFLLLAVLAHAAVGVGGLVTAEPLARLHAAENSFSWAAFAFWALFNLPFTAPAAPFFLTLIWGLAGFVLAYGALARLLGHFAALAAVGTTLVLGYPGWHATLPTSWQFWLLPAALAALVASLFVKNYLAPARAAIDRLIAKRTARALWVVLLIFAFFVVAEQARLGTRGAYGGKFPYEKHGLRQGFATDLSLLRRLHHTTHYLRAIRRMNDNALLHDNAQVCLAAHGAAARFVCRIGRARPDATLAHRTPRIMPAGWILQMGPFGTEPAFGSGGIRYPRLEGRVNGEPAGNWFDLRARVLQGGATHVRVRGPIFTRAASKDLYVEIETTNPRGIAAKATYDGKPVVFVRRDLPAGDLMIVRFATRLPSPLPRSGVPIDIEVQAPSGLLDFDLLLTGVEMPANTETGRKEIKPFTFEAL